MHTQVSKTVLDNGLTILILPQQRIPKVSIQLWYGVGSKDELDGERGLAHLLEHMIFKGTDILSESDINMITHRFSGSCNAFTSYDYTAYVFDFPKQNWHVSLPLLANCMRKCTFKEDLLNAELKAVIQELKMYNDDYIVTLTELLASSIFARQTYHYPIIGYKQDLWSITRDKLFDFYQYHYVPNNATLIIVGDVSIPFALKEAKKAFDQVPYSSSFKKRPVLFDADMKAKKISIYRDIQSPFVVFAWVVPGVKDDLYQAELIAWILQQPKGSRLYQELVIKNGLASDIVPMVYHMFEKTILFMIVHPLKYEYIDQIKHIIKETIADVKNKGFADDEIVRAYNQVYLDYLGIFEDRQKLGYELGKVFQATGQEDRLFQFLTYSDQLKEDLHSYFNTYIRPTTMHEAYCLPLDEKELSHWQQLQERVDQSDETVLEKKVRATEVECGIYIEQLVVQEAATFTFAHAQKYLMDNGLKLLSHSIEDIPKIDLILEFKASHLYDPREKQGLFNFMMHAMLVRTQKYTDLQSFAEHKGIAISLKDNAVHISLLKQDLNLGLELLEQIIKHALFDEHSIENVRNYLLGELALFWDDPFQFSSQLIRSELYKNHPYAHNQLGSKEVIEAITIDDLKDAYARWISPDAAYLSIVGDLYDLDIKNLINTKFENWNKKTVDDLQYPALKAVAPKMIEYPINRDQTVLCFAGLSVSRLDPAYYHLLLFDQIFTGGILGSMSSLLFQLRERTGLFYTITGSCVSECDEQPGLIDIRTIVSNARLQEAQKLIQDIIAKASTLIKDDDLQHAKNAVINSLVDLLQTNEKLAHAFIFLERLKLPANYFEVKIDILKNTDATTVRNTVKEFLNLDRLIQVKIGRV